MSHDALDAVSALLGADTTLGIIAGLTIAAQRSQSEDEDADPTVTTRAAKHESGKQPRRNTDRRGTVAVPGGGLQPPGTPSSLSSASKKYSVQDQREAIRKFQTQNQILKQELAIESRDAKLLLGPEKQQQVDYLQKTTASFTRKLELVQKNLARVDELIAKREHELELLRQQQSVAENASSSSSSTASSKGSSSSSSPAPAMADATGASRRRVRALENRLELSLVKKNEMDSINKHLRAQIERVRRDRIIFDGIYKKLEREMCEFQQRYEASVDELARVLAAKADVTSEMQRIQGQAERDQRNYEQQFQDLKSAIESCLREANARGLDSFLSLASPGADASESSSLGDHHSSSKRKQTAKETTLTRVAALSSWKIGFERALTTTSDDEVAKYDQAFRGIRQLTGVTDMNEIASELLRRDEDNFKRFKHVEELQSEEAALQAQIAQLELDIEAFKAHEGLATSAAQKAQYRALEAKHQRVQQRNAGLDAAAEETTNEISRVKSSVHSIHSMLVHASGARNLDPFGHGHGSHAALGAHSARDITDANLLEYLQAIETFSSGLVKEHHDIVAATSAAMLNAEAGEESAHAGTHTTSHHAPPALVSSSPVGYGPATLASDPSQKLHIQVPSFGGVNGVLLLPANSPYAKDSAPQNTMIAGAGSRTDLAHPHQQQLGPQSRKKSSRFELSSRKSLSQRQFAAALSQASSENHEQDAGAEIPDQHAGADPVKASTPDFVTHAPVLTQASATGGTAVVVHEPNEEEDERALTYEELKQFAAKSIIQRKNDESVKAMAHRNTSLSPRHHN